MDRTVNITQSIHRNQVQEWEYYGVVPFSSIMSTLQLLLSNITIKTFNIKISFALYHVFMSSSITLKGLLRPFHISSSGDATYDNLSNVRFNFKQLAIHRISTKYLFFIFIHKHIHSYKFFSFFFNRCELRRVTNKKVNACSTDFTMSMES